MRPQKIGLALFFAVLPLLCSAADNTLLPIEQEVAEAVRSADPTVVHFWATWCPNCRAELASQGWKAIIEDNPNVHFVFVTIWSEADGREILARYGIGGQKNFTLVGHPDHSRQKETRVKSFLGEELPWIPTTRIYQQGQLHYALNYGEIRFPILQQFIQDSSNKWAR